MAHFVVTAEQNIYPFSHLAALRYKGYVTKSHVQLIIGVFRDDLGNIKGTIMVHGVQRVFKECDQPCVVKSVVTLNIKGPKFKRT